MLTASTVRLFIRHIAGDIRGLSITRSYPTRKGSLRFAITQRFQLRRGGEPQGIDAGLGRVFVLLSASSTSSHGSDEFAATVDG